MPTKRDLLISIKPRYADMIFDGTKTVELRRQAPKMAAGDQMIIYVSSPRMELAGSAKITGIQSDTPQKMWRKISQISGITKAEFDKYFEGATQAVAIEIEEAQKFLKPLALEDLKKKHGIQPPQSFRYVEHLALSRST